ncbi:DNA polymerase IV [Bacterioplanoides pacificum]|uniref:DNA polymerase IV n=1 Tax=Bacterioplanoides pacificum TaxID=1171596 RepID=A0ABV7VM39_9GAMM
MTLSVCDAAPDPALKRKVIHIDCDCFFAAVEMRENPAYRDIPIAIGGDASRRGVISTCNYPAREFGVRSAMPTAQALKLCPQLTLVPGQMALYREVSRQVMVILQQYAWQRDGITLLQQVSVDEAYLEIDPALNASDIAERIRTQVREQVGITVSAGIAPNKFLAKVASDWNKPDGLCVVKPHRVMDFVSLLDVGKIPGIGPAMQKKLEQQGIETCEQAQQWSQADLVRTFGRMGAMLYQRCRGIDTRQLSLGRERKSIGVERTFAQDLAGEQACLEQLPRLWQLWTERVAKTEFEVEQLAPFVKVKFADFSQTTLADAHEIASEQGFARLLTQAIKRKNQGVRLLGIGGRCPQLNQQQLALF